MDKHLNAAEEIGDDGQFPSELRYDMISQNWVVIASGRSQRPETFKQKSSKKEESGEEDCPFCNRATFSQTVEVFSHGEKKDPEKDLPEDWTAASIPNKFPAFIPDDELNEQEENGLYKRMNAVGYHEVIVTRDHYLSLGEMETGQVKEVLDLYKIRYNDLKDKKNVNYISIFHNHGKEAGASIAHPHSQLATTPLIDVDVSSGLDTAEEYMREKGRCVYCDMQEWEKKQEDRIVYENDHFLVLCPFASTVAFQVIVTPKKHSAYFEEISEEHMWSLADAFGTALAKVHRGIGDPPYNFYLHTAPCDGEDHDSYHWHWTILPKTSVFAGFELGAGMEISTIKPENAAEHLRQV